MAMGPRPYKKTWWFVYKRTKQVPWDIRRIVDRVHVMDTDLEVCRFFVGRLDKEGWRKLPVRERKGILGLVIRHHRRNREQYLNIQNGTY